MKKRYIQHCLELKGKFAGGPITDHAMKQMIVDIIQFVGKEKIKIAFPQYQQGNWFKKVLENLLKQLKIYYAQTANMAGALDALLGKDSIPIMTAHKSKGLEYHTVIFIGLEDGAFWTYEKQKESDNNLVFVALSRAKERVLFTFCSNRGRPQTATSIESIHKLLKESPDVTIVDLRPAAVS